MNKNIEDPLTKMLRECQLLTDMHYPGYCCPLTADIARSWATVLEEVSREKGRYNIPLVVQKYREFLLLSPLVPLDSHYEYHRMMVVARTLARPFLEQHGDRLYESGLVFDIDITRTSWDVCDEVKKIISIGARSFSTCEHDLQLPDRRALVEIACDLSTWEQVWHDILGFIAGIHLHGAATFDMGNPGMN